MRPRTRVSWTGPEEIKLRKLYPCASWEEIETALPRHNLIAIKARAKKLKLCRDRDIYRDGRHPLIEVLVNKRRKLGRPGIDVAVEIDTPLTWLYRLEGVRGNRLPMGDTLERWANALDFELTLVPRT